MVDNMTAQQFGNQRVKDQRAKSYYDMLSLNEGNKSKSIKILLATVQ